MKYIEAWKYYNANVHGKNVEDCPKRALSLAYDIPYNEAGKVLRSQGYADWHKVGAVNKAIQ